MIMMYNKDNGDKPKKKLTKATGMKTFTRAAIRDIKGKKLNEAQKSALKDRYDMKDNGGLYGGMFQDSKVGREAAKRRFDRETKFLEETRQGQRILKVQAKKGTTRTEPRFNLEARKRITEAYESTFKNNQYEKIKGMYE